MSFELRIDKNKRAFTLSRGQYEYSNSVNDEVIKIVTFNALPLRRRMYFTQEHIDYKYEYLKENINEIIELLSNQLSAVTEIISDAYKTRNIEQCYDDLYNLFFLILSDGSQLMELAISQSECEDRYVLPKLECIPTFDANIKVDYSDCKTNYCYIINSVTEYINILFYTFISNNPIISVCQNCDKLFIPKTKKITLYCDRTTNEHVTCKQIGAKNKFNDRIEADHVLKAYQLEKHRIQMYCLRSKQDKYDFFNDYYDWLDMFESKITDYKNGNYDGNKLIEEIKEQTQNFQPYSKGKDFADEEGY